MMMEVSESERIIFGDPFLADIDREGICGVDMHCHTNHSDAPVKISDLLRYAEKKKIGIAITDHNQVSGSIQAIKNSRTTLVIPGIEVSALDGPHILLYFYQPGDLQEFYKTSIERKKQKSPYLAIRATTSDILDQASDYSCICSAAHPYGYLLFNKGIGRCVERHYLPETLISRFDAIEVISGGMKRCENMRAVELAGKYQRGLTGGSDAHLLKDYGRVLTFAPDQGVHDFLDAVLKQRNFVIGKEKSLIDKGLMGALITPRYLPYLIPSIAIHYEQNIPRLKRFLMKKAGSGKE
ncbi:MAG: PHP domain-containing protein [Methanoregulaceae archaeon]|jgi:hypothetical protein|nr:PHP domain-containing protein [Methanoregulaceae archaeon]